MKSVLRRTPSAPMIVAVIALVVAASGTAVAAGRLVSGDALIKRHSLSGNRLRNHTITGQQINLSKLGTVPNATKATNATNATNSTNAVSATTAGSAAISKVTYASATVSVPNSGTAQLVTANCPTGTNVVGGGVQLADESGSAVVLDSYPNGKTGWSADVANFGGAASNATVTALCAPAAATG